MQNPFKKFESKSGNKTISRTDFLKLFFFMFDFVLQEAPLTKRITFNNTSAL